MAYFSALGGTGGTSATITVTYSEDFYGLTITATNGTTTLTKTATSSGTLTFDVSEGGTWVVSGTVEGATYSESVDVTFEYTAPPLVALPNGSTALPVNDIQMWLKCAAIRDKTTYTTLSDVLGDTETFIALCADSNACDYMARSTTWASGVAADSTAMLIVGKYNYCANKLISNATWCEALAESTYYEYVFNGCVPILSSDTWDGGQTICDSVYNPYYAYKAFDGNIGTGWTSTGSFPHYIGCKFNEPVNVRMIGLAFGGDSATLIRGKDFKIQGSNTGNVDDWTDLATCTWLQSYGVSNVHYFECCDNNVNYTYYRIYVTTTWSSSSYCDVQTLQFYGRTDNANYIPLVPVMTSNTTPSGVASAGEENARAYYAFDGNPSTKWYSGTSGTDTYIGYQFPSAVEISAWGFAGNTDSPLIAPSKIVIQKSDDGVTYTDVQTFDNLPNDGQFHMYPLDSSITTAYIRAKTYKRNVSGNIYAQLSRLQFYRDADSTDVIIHSAVEDNIFYMDDGSPVALCGIPVGDTIDVDLEAYKGQTLTLVSTVAKDPTNLSNDFTMPIRITPNITEIYLMPYGALYWYGYNNGVEAGTSANGWTGSHMGGSVTFNKDSASIIAGSGQETGLTTHDAITAFDKLHCIVNTSYNSTIFLMYGSKNYAGSVLVQKTLSTGLTHDELTITSETGYPMIYEYNNKTITGYAMWIA